MKIVVKHVTTKRNISKPKKNTGITYQIEYQQVLEVTILCT